MSKDNEYGTGKEVAAGTATLKTGVGSVYDVTITPAAADVTVTLRDGGAGGAIIWKGIAKASTASVSASFPMGKRFNTDLYVDVSGAAGVAYVSFV